MAEQKCRFCVVCGAKFTGRSSYKSKWRHERICRANTVCRVGDRPVEPVQPMESGRPMKSAPETRNGSDAVAVAGPSRPRNESSESAGGSLVHAQVDPPGSDSSDDEEPPAVVLRDLEFPVWEEAQFDFNINLFPELDFGYWEDGLPAHPPAAVGDDDGPVNLLPEWDFGNWEDGLPVHPPAAVREDVGPVNPFTEPDGEEDGFSVHPPAAVREDVGPVNPFPEPDGEEDGFSVHPPSVVREDVGPVNPLPEPDGEEDGFSVHPPAVVRINGGSEATRVEVAEAVHFAIGLAPITSEARFLGLAREACPNVHPKSLLAYYDVYHGDSVPPALGPDEEAIWID